MSKTMLALTAAAGLILAPLAINRVIDWWKMDDYEDDESDDDDDKFSSGQTRFAVEREAAARGPTRKPNRLSLTKVILKGLPASQSYAAPMSGYDVAVASHAPALGPNTYLS